MVPPMGDQVALGVMPVFKKGCADNPQHVRALVEMLEAEGVESIWAVEHVVVAKDYEPRYSYSASGRMGGSPDTQMPDPLEERNDLGPGDDMQSVGGEDSVGVNVGPLRLVHIEGHWSQ